MTIWTPEISHRHGPKYKAIADALAEDVRSGVLSAGARLPTQRHLAGHLGVALTTVTRAYTEAERRLLVTGVVGRGTFVRSRAAALSGQEETANRAIDLRPNVLMPWDHAPALADSLSRIMARSDPYTMLDYQPMGGSLLQRAAGATWARRAGLDIPDEGVVITSGAQHAILVSLATLTQANDLILAEELTYGGLKSAASFLDLRIRGVAMDEEGIRPAALDEACAREQPKALFCSATLQNPTSALMSPRRRMEIAEVARRHGVPIVEDDSYGFLQPHLQPLACFAADAFYICSASKSLAAGLRIAYVIPPPDMVDRLTANVCSTTYMAAPALADVVAAWLADGTADQIMEWKRVESAARQAMATRVLSRYGYTGHPSAHHGWLTLPEPWTTVDFVAQAGMRGVLVPPADDFQTGRERLHAVRLSLGPPASRDILEKGLICLSEILAESPEPRGTVV